MLSISYTSIDDSNKILDVKTYKHKHNVVELKNASCGVDCSRKLEKTWLDKKGCRALQLILPAPFNSLLDASCFWSRIRDSALLFFKTRIMFFTPLGFICVQPWQINTSNGINNCALPILFCPA